MRLAQLDRAFDYGSKGREFESSIARTKHSALPDAFFAFDALGKLYCRFAVIMIYLYDKIPEVLFHERIKRLRKNHT